MYEVAHVHYNRNIFFPFKVKKKNLLGKKKDCQTSAYYVKGWNGKAFKQYNIPSQTAQEEEKCL